MMAGIWAILSDLGAGGVLPLETKILWQIEDIFNAHFRDKNEVEKFDQVSSYIQPCFPLTLLECEGWVL